MPIVNHKPAARGVSTLMYVGDAEPPPSPFPVLKIAVAVAIAWVLLRR
jgi:hypothetical protein